MEKKIIEEVIIKKKQDKASKERLSQQIKTELLNKKKRRETKAQYLTAQQIVKNYREKQKSYASFKRKLRSNSKMSSKLHLFDPSRTNSPIIIIRISGKWERIADAIKTILVKLKLTKLYSAIILKYDQETLQMINLIEAYITWGFIKKTTISDMLHKRGSFKNENNEVNELDNAVIESKLGTYGIFCLEDIIHELNTGGKYAKEVMGSLGFFLLSKTEEITEKINIPFAKGGSQGFRGDQINELLKKMI